MEQDLQLVLVGVADPVEARRLRGHLEDLGIEVFLRTDPAECNTKNCSPKIELHVMSRDLEKVKAFLQTEHSKSIDGLEINPQWLQEVFDTSKDTAICPACGTSFSTTARECPDCGLGFVV